MNDAQLMYFMNSLSNLFKNMMGLGFWELIETTYLKVVDEITALLIFCHEVGLVSLTKLFDKFDDIRA